MSAKWEGAVGYARSLVRRVGESDTGLVIAKSAVAATAAWIVAGELLAAPSATFAPFTAVLMMHATVSRSVDHALRYTTAMLGGVVLAGVLSPLLGAAWWTFGLLVMLALALGRWHRLGTYGPQVAVAAMFAYATLVQPTDEHVRWSALGSIAGMVLLGAVIAVVVNFALLPPVRYRAAHNGVRGLSREMTGLMGDVAEGIRAAKSLDQHVKRWTERTDALSRRAVEVRRSVDEADESMRFNPRRFLVHRKESFDGYRCTVRSLHRIADQLRLVITDVSYLDRTGSGMTSNAAGVLSATAEVTSVLGTLYSEQDLHRIDELRSHLRRGEQCCRDISKDVKEHHRREPDELLSSETLHTDLRRMVDEGERVRDELDGLRQRRAPSF